MRASLCAHLASRQLGRPLMASVTNQLLGFYLEALADKLRPLRGLLAVMNDKEPVAECP